MDYNRPINCLHPVIILNPDAYRMISKHRNYVLRGDVVTFKKFPSKLYFDKVISSLSAKRLKITHDDLESCYIDAHYERIPLFIEVKCGKCDICRESKRNSLVRRMKLESLLYKYLPIFLTLTYNEENIKKNREVSVDDVQRFLKRLRINLYRAGYRERLRYVLVSEYGKLGRPHYHAVLWNLHETPLISYRQIVEIIEKSWSKGFITARLIDLSDDRAFRYTAKYLSKNEVSTVPEGCRKNFLLASNRNGGIGSGFIALHAREIFKRLDCNFKYLNRFSGKTEQLVFDKYVIDKIFPSYSQSIPLELRNAITTCLLHMVSLNTNAYEIDTKIDLEKYKEFVFIPNLSDVVLPISLSSFTPQMSNYQLIRSLHVLNKYDNRIDDLRERYKRSFQRQTFLDKLFMQPFENRNLKEYAFDIVRNNEIEFNRQQL